MMAICAGFVAQVASDYAGDIGPFQVAIALTVLTLVLIVPWRENYGVEKEEEAEGVLKLGDEVIEETDGKGIVKKEGWKGESNGDVKGQSKKGVSDGSEVSFTDWSRVMVRTVVGRPMILCLGLSQAFFEGAVYTFGK